MAKAKINKYAIIGTMNARFKFAISAIRPTPRASKAPPEIARHNRPEIAGCGEFVRL